MDTTQRLRQLLDDRILIIDGAMGTMVQQHKLQERDYRVGQFANWHTDLKGNFDVLCISRPDIIKDIHKKYLKAGANIIETNTFNAQSVSLADYDLQKYAFDINVAAAQVARQAIDEHLSETAQPDKRHPSRREHFVAGAIGPMNKTLSLSPDVNNPGYRSVTFDEVADAYYEQIAGLVTGGVDILMIETIFDTLNAKAAIYAVNKYFKETGKEKLPIMISGTITDASGRTLSGQTLEAFYVSVMHANPLSIGLNCALGAAQMKPHIEELSAIAECYVSAYPNAGLPNAMGEYDEMPAKTAEIIAGWAQEGWVNLVGGCCGTTPAHIAAIANAVRRIAPRRLPTLAKV